MGKVDNVINDLMNIARLEFSDTTEKSPETSTDIELYCLCHRPDDGRLMVQCDQCDCWSEDVTTMDMSVLYGGSGN